MLVKVESKLTYVDADGKPVSPDTEDALQERPCAPVREKLGLPAGVTPRAPAKPPHRVLGRNRKRRPDGCSVRK